MANNDINSDLLENLMENLKNQFGEAKSSLFDIFSLNSAATMLISKTKDSISQLKEINSLLTETSKIVGHLSKAELSNIGKTALDQAAKYGINASDYIASVQEMYKAGYDNAKNMAELSTLAQVAGNLDSDLANDYLTATDAAYKLNANTQALNQILDGQNQIARRNSLSLMDLAEATKTAASQSADSGIAINEATAAMSTMIATTKESGETVAEAWQDILMYIQQVKGETGHGEILDDKSLSEYENACNALGVSLKEVKNGVTSLRDPMVILEQLSKAYNSLDKSDSRRTDLINAVGGGNNGEQLNALLENWSLYDRMLKDYAAGSGSAMESAMESANNLEGSMNRLGNTFTQVISNIVNSDGIITITNCLNGVLSVINTLTSKLGSLGTIGLGAGLFASLKNVGRDKMYSIIQNANYNVCSLGY